MNQLDSRTTTTMNQKHLVFISHSSKDKQVADAITSRLEAREIRCWIAPRDIRPGSDYSKQIVEAIKNCTVMVVVFSHWTNASRHIQSEVDRAFNAGKTIIPFRIDKADLDESLEYYLSKTHWLDAINPPLDSHIERLGDGILGTPTVTQSAPTQTRRKFQVPILMASALLLFCITTIALFVLGKKGRFPAIPTRGPSSVQVPSTRHQATLQQQPPAPSTVAPPAVNSEGGSNVATSTVPAPAFPPPPATSQETDNRPEFVKMAEREERNLRASVLPDQLVLINKLWVKMALHAIKKPGTPIKLIGAKVVSTSPSDLRVSPDGINLNVKICDLSNLSDDQQAEIMAAPHGVWIYLEGTSRPVSEYQREVIRREPNLSGLIGAQTPITISKVTIVPAGGIGPFLDNLSQFYSNN